MAKLSRKKISEILIRAILKNLYRKTSPVESVLIKIAGIDSRTATLLKKVFPITTLDFLMKCPHELRFW